MYTASSNQRIGQWTPEVIYTPLSCTGDADLLYMIYKLVWEERPIEEFAPHPMSIEEQTLAELYAEFAEEDRELAEMGLIDYARLLQEEEATI